MKTPILETTRLVLHPLTLADAPCTQTLFPHWEIVRYLAADVPWPYPDDGAENFYRNVTLPAVERQDEWAWTLRLKDSPQHHVGAISLLRSEQDNRGFWLGLPWHGQGLMSEAVDALNDLWFGELGFETLRTCKAAANLASRRISEKTGMRLIETFERQFVSGHLPAERWELTRAQWKDHSR